MTNSSFFFSLLLISLSSCLETSLPIFPSIEASSTHTIFTLELDHSVSYLTIDRSNIICASLSIVKWQNSSGFCHAKNMRTNEANAFYDSPYSQWTMQRSFFFKTQMVFPSAIDLNCFTSLVMLEKFSGTPSKSLKVSGNTRMELTGDLLIWKTWVF